MKNYMIICIYIINDTNKLGKLFIVDKYIIKKFLFCLKEFYLLIKN